ncbi:single-stranded DNA-binding protein [Priestia megaterium]|uniref:single-stranded DNA-binding protein n=1 Tax=Priestia megaterium TaxID=1404 RepID=UPI000CA1D925|nr:single-stranded DNA-binding protein [Priestia megaterium]AUO14768.1 single-stranded DNA-binding protein [Priestia megaterium]
MNTVQLIGNISNEITLNALPSGKFVAKFNVAVTNPYNREKTSFVPVEVWNRQAENTSNFCSKGSKVGIVGHIEIDQYEKDGQKKTFTKVVASNVEFLSPKGDNGGSNTNTSGSNRNANAGGNNNYSDPFGGGQTIEISDDSLPF